MQTRASTISEQTDEEITTSFISGDQNHGAAGGRSGRRPAGLAAAMHLAHFGVPCRLIDRLTEPDPHSRAISLQARTPDYSNNVHA